MIEKLKNNKKIINIGKILSGNAGGQIISLVTLPLLTRLYGSTIIGHWALLVSITMIFNSFSDLGLTDKIMIEEKDKDAKKIIALIESLGLFFSVLAFVINYWGISIFTIRDYNPFFLSLLLSINILLSQRIQIYTVWFNRKKEYSILMKNPLVNNLTFSIIALIFGVFGITKYGYFVGFILGQIFTLLHMRFRVTEVNRIGMDEKLSIIKANTRFVYYQMPSYILVQIKTQLPTILIKAFYGFEILGYYSLAYRMLNLPVTLIAGAIGKVFFQTIAEKEKHGEDIGYFTLASLKQASKISIIPLIIILSFGDIIVQTIFGFEYIVSGNIMRLMIFYGYFLFLSMATSGVSTVIQKQQYILVSSIFQIISFSLGLFIGDIFFSSIYVGVFLMSFSYSIIQIVYFTYIFKAMDVRVSKYIYNTILSLFIVLIISSIIVFFRK